MVATMVLLDESHLLSVETMFTDEEMQRYSLIPVPTPNGFVRVWFDAYEQGRKDGTRELFAWVDEAGVFLGYGLCFGPQPGTAQLELGYTVVMHHRGKGLAKQMLRELTAWAVQTHAPQRIELHIQPANIASQAVARASGYVYEGTKRNVHLKQDRRVDKQVWSRIPSDPPMPGP